VSVLRSLLLFALAALAEIGVSWLVWQGVREHMPLNVATLKRRLEGPA